MCTISNLCEACCEEDRPICFQTIDTSFSCSLYKFEDISSRFCSGTLVSAADVLVKVEGTGVVAWVELKNQPLKNIFGDRFPNPDLAKKIRCSFGTVTTNHLAEPDKIRGFFLAVSYEKNKECSKSSLKSRAHAYLQARGFVLSGTSLSLKTSLGETCCVEFGIGFCTETFCKEIEGKLTS